MIFLIFPIKDHGEIAYLFYFIISKLQVFRVSSIRLNTMLERDYVFIFKYFP